MASRRRLGVALVFDAPVADEIDGLRRGLSDRALERIAPHITLVPPVNIRADALGDCLAVVRSSAAGSDGPLGLTLGPPASFLPANPVLVLSVTGDLGPLRALRDRVFAPPLARDLSWPWVPHVTLADQVPEAQIVSAVDILDGYRADVVIDRVVLLEESKTEEGRRWRPLADAWLGPRHVVGRGGLALELTRSRMLDPEAQALGGLVGLVGASSRDGALPDGLTSGPRPPIVVTGRREGGVVGVARAWTDDAGGHVAVLVAPDVRRQGIGSHLLAHLEAAVDDAGWRAPVLGAIGPDAFYRARSRRSRVAATD